MSETELVLEIIRNSGIAGGVLFLLLFVVKKQLTSLIDFLIYNVNKKQDDLIKHQEITCKKLDHIAQDLDRLINIITKLHEEQIKYNTEILTVLRRLQDNPVHIDPEILTILKERKRD